MPGRDLGGPPEPPGRVGQRDFGWETKIPHFDTGVDRLRVVVSQRRWALVLPEVHVLPDVNAAMHVVLYTRRGCHLCEEARDVIAAYGLEPRLVDVDADAELRERFNECVPVVEIDGKIRFRGRVDPVLLRRLMAMRPTD